MEAAVRELMRWLAPGPATDTTAARRQLIRDHQAFLYDTVADRSRVTTAAPGPVGHAAENPYSKLAVDILQTIREQQLTMSPSIVGYLKMLVTLGTLRHQLAIEYDLQANVRHFVRRLARQQGIAWLDPRRTLDRLYAGSGRLQRGLEFLEFLESQQPVILEAEASLFGFRRRMRTARRRLVTLGMSVLLVGALLYLVLVFPDDTRRVLPAGMDYTWVHVGLLVVLVSLILTLINHIRGLGRED